LKTERKNLAEKRKIKALKTGGSKEQVSQSKSGEPLEKKTQGKKINEHQLVSSYIGK